MFFVQLCLEHLISSSPSSLTSKKSNELIQGGLSSIKNAATSMVKRMGEIKEVISTSSNSNHVKVSLIDKIAGGDNDEIESNDGSDAGERHRRISGELASYKGSCANLKDYDEPLPENLYQTPKDEKVGKCSSVFRSCQNIENNFQIVWIFFYSYCIFLNNKTKLF